MRLLLISMLLVAGCSKKSADKCTRVIDKSMKVLGEIAALRGAQLGDKERTQLIQQCRDATKGGREDPEIACVLAAEGDDAVRKCYIKGYEQHLARSKEIEAKVQLSNLGKGAKVVFQTKGEFPKGKVGLTPATPCCSEQIKQCIPTEAMWSDPVWQALGFRVDGAFNFQYSYESADGKTFTATAVGDVGCTGKPVTHTITAKIGADGQPEITGP